MATTEEFPIDLRNPGHSTLQGNSFWTVVALTDYDLGVWEFVKDVNGVIYGVVNAPGVLAGTPNAKIKLVILANATSGVTRLRAASKCVAEGESFNPAALVEDTAQDITVPATAYGVKTVTFTGGDLANIVADDQIIVEIFHEGVHANDTLAVSTLLLDARLVVDTA